MSSRVAVFTHADCLRHDTGPGHPEQPARLRVLLDTLRSCPTVEVRSAPAGDLEPILAVHPADHVDRLERFSATGGGSLTPDTAMNAATWPAVLGATGAVTAAVDHALGGGAGTHAFAAVRPPGHHASAREAMGFCFCNNVVIGARWAQRHGAAQVLILDWDVHHGNGTQDLVEHDPTIRFVSLHQWPWYPGTGAAAERGVGNVFNVPRPPGLPPKTYVDDLSAALGEALAGWRPDLILVSAGFDAMRGDPLGGFTLEPEHYAELTRRIRAAAPEVPIVGLLEGGYIPERLAQGALAHIVALA